MWAVQGHCDRRLSLRNLAVVLVGACGGVVGEEVAVMAEMAEFVDATVACSKCGHTARCIRTTDGTVYRPAGWAYPDPDAPMVGVCGRVHEDDVLEVVKEVGAARGAGRGECGVRALFERPERS